MRVWLPTVILLLGGCLADTGATTRLEALLAREGSIHVDFVHAPATPPSTFAMNELRKEVESATGKSLILGKPVVDPYLDRERWSEKDLYDLERRLAAFDPLEPRIVVAYVAGEREEAPSTLGLAYDRLAVLFAGPPLVQLPSLREAGVAERSVLIHEVGHLLGLVNDGLPMVRPHESRDHPHHSSNPESVMWSGIDFAEAIMSRILEDRAPPYRFDADDLADIRSFQESLLR